MPYAIVWYTSFPINNTHFWEKELMTPGTERLVTADSCWQTDWFFPHRALRCPWYWLRPRQSLPHKPLALQPTPLPRWVMPAASHCTHCRVLVNVLTPSPGTVVSHYPSQGTVVLFLPILEHCGLVLIHPKILWSCPYPSQVLVQCPCLSQGTVVCGLVLNYLRALTQCPFLS